MAFSVRLTRAAENDIDEIKNFIAADSPRLAKQWFDKLFRVLESLSEMPSRHSLIVESAELKRVLRSVPFYSHRVVYEIDESRQIVLVVRIYHSARRPMDLEDLM